jgi:hypothetical protein
MRRLSYFKRASRRFLQGTRHRTPAEAVEAGSRTLEQWVNILSEERELEGVFVQERKMRLQHRRLGGDHAAVQAAPDVQTIQAVQTVQAAPAEPLQMLAGTSSMHALNI